MIRASNAIMPDRASRAFTNSGIRPKRVGVFVDDMAQNIITRVYNFRLDYVQLHGSETPDAIDNLRRTIDPDIHQGIKIIKTISVSSADDMLKGHDYEGHADMLLFDTKCATFGGSGNKFDWTLIERYDGSLPFLLSGGIGPDDAAAICSLKHPLLAGIDVNSRFETAPGVKDIGLLETFVNYIRNHTSKS